MLNNFTIALEKPSTSVYNIKEIFPSMAQLDNAADSDSEERGFESLWAGQKNASTLVVGVFLFS